VLGRWTLGAVAAVVACLLAASATSARPSIVGGQPAPDGTWPSVVFLYGTYQGQPYGCTGEVVASDWVLSAAHCAYGAPGQFASTMTAVLGVKNYDDQNRTVIQVDKLVVDPAYDAVRDVNDIAMFHLHTPTTIPAMRLASMDGASAYVSYEGTPNAAGWGTTDADSTMLTTVLRQAYLRVPSGDECKAEVPQMDRATQICAGTQNVAGACHGDSGGPLVAFDKATNEPVLWGITSYGPQAAAHLAPCSTALPVIYTWVPAFAGFITATIASTAAASAPPPATTTTAPPVPSGPVPPAPTKPSAACTTARTKLTAAKKAENSAYKHLRKLRAAHASRKKVGTASTRYHALRTKRIKALGVVAHKCG
jgi:secreted trypsin-like serine protease